MSLSVEVLCPNGHRAKVKVNPNTPVLQVLEEACRKKGFDPLTHDLKHHKRILNTTDTIRFANLPNNAQLELIPSETKKEDAPVSIVVQLESGERLPAKEFPSNATLKEISEVLELLGKENPGEEPVFIDMGSRREVVGQQTEVTTLRNLGLTKGRHLLRFIYKKPEILKEQASVYNMKEAVKETDPAKKEEKWRAMRVEADKRVIDVAKAVIKDEPMDTKDEPMDTETPKNTGERETEKSKSENVEVKDEEKSVKSEPSNEDRDNEPEMRSPSPEEDEILHYIGDRNAVVYDSSTVSTSRMDTIDDSFFDLTITDVKRLQRDLTQQARETSEGGVMMTAAMRAAQEEAKKMEVLNRYSKAVIRVRFPGHLVIQAGFLCGETVGDVKEFIRQFLVDDQSPFELFITPPKSVLDASKTLLDAGCVPTRLLHFDPAKNTDEYLKDEIKSQLSNRRGVEKAFQETSGKRVRPVTSSSVEASTPSSTPSSVMSSSVVPESSPVASKRPKASPDQKVPKWFKPGGKK